MASIYGLAKISKCVRLIGMVGRGAAIWAKDENLVICKRVGVVMYYYEFISCFKVYRVPS